MADPLVPPGAFQPCSDVTRLWRVYRIVPCAEVATTPGLGATSHRVLDTRLLGCAQLPVARLRNSCALSVFRLFV
jgi:hypothetical protein